MVRLYEAWSEVDGYRRRDEVRFKWFVVERPEPVAPYEELIEDYEDLKNVVGPSDARGYVERYADELLTQAEVEDLRGYLAQHHNEQLRAREQEVPINWRDDDTCSSLGYGVLRTGEGFRKLSKEDDYALSVPIYARYDLRDCPASLELSSEEKKVGARFVTCVLQAMHGREWPRDTATLEGLVVEIYDDTGLYVQKGNRKPERFKERQAWEAQRAQRPRDSVSPF